MAFRQIFSKHSTHSNMQLNKVGALWNYTGVGSKEKRWLSEVAFWNIINIQTFNWKKCALCQSNLSGGLQAETMAFRRSFLKHCTHANMYALCESTLSGALQAEKNSFQKKFFKTLYTFKHTIEQNMRPGKGGWVMGFNQKQWLSEEVFQNIIHI